MASVARRRGAQRGLRARIVLLTMAGTLGPTAIFGWLSWSSVGSLEERVLAERQELAISVAAHVDSLMNSELESLEAISPAPEVGIAGTSSVARVALREACLRSRFLSRAFLLDSSGRLIVAEPADGPAAPSRELPAVREALESGVPEVSALSRDAGGARRLFLLVPLRNLQARWRAL